MASLTAEGSLFSQLGKHEVFVPTKTYPPARIHDLAVLARDAVGGDAA